MARLRLEQYASDPELTPQTASCLLLAHGYAAVAAPSLAQGIATLVPELLWQATDSVACRLALALRLNGQPLAADLAKAVKQLVARQVGGAGGVQIWAG